MNASIRQLPDHLANQITRLAARGLLEKLGEGRRTSWRLRDRIVDERNAPAYELSRRIGAHPTSGGTTTDARRDEVVRLLRSGPAGSAEIARSLSLSRQGALNILNRLSDEGIVRATETNRRNPSNRWMLDGGDSDR